LWYVHPRPTKNKVFGYFVQLFWLPFPDRVGRNIICIAQKKN